jgi:dihydrodipicolinate synthase/N-acetylneuraminate lyase
MPLDGITCPIATPLGASGDSLDATAFVAHIDALLPDIDGLFVLGSSGEHPWLSDAVEDEIVKIAAEATAGRRPLLVGAGQASLARTLIRLESLSALPGDYYVVTPPSYFPITDPGSCVEYFTSVANHADRPIVLYNIPQNVGNGIAPAAVRDLAGHPNIAGIKDSSGNMIAFTELLATNSPSFRVLQGREQLIAASGALGCTGTVSAMSNFAPRLLRQVLDAARHGNSAASAALQADTSQLARIFDEGYWLSALKAALTEIGFPVGIPSKPLPRLTDHQSARIAALIHNADVHGWLTRPRQGT